QMVKSAEVAERRPFEDFLADPWTEAHLDFLSLADRWADAVGPEALQVRVYPSEQPVLVDFLNTTQLPRWIAKLPYAQNRANPSLSPAQVVLKTGLPQDQVGFADDQARASFLARFSVQNLDICKKYRPDLKTLFPI
ncbi:MAG: hypothetical protein AAGA78_10930, partial [Pseudomonadota bacterium]